MTKIDRLNLRATEPDQQKQFYCDVLGMRALTDGSVGYGDAQVSVKFLPAQRPYNPKRTDLYWKIAISVPNIELSFDQLRKAGVKCSQPRQFEDVGYLAHFTDPEGFEIELIDHEFECQRRDLLHDPNLLGGGPHISLVTLRTSDIASVEPVLLGWGMRKLSVQPLASYGFTLHFYGFGVDVPPDPDLRAVANRTWVYQRHVTLLELQHVHALKTETLPEEGAAGFDHLALSSHDQLAPLKRLRLRWMPPNRQGA